MNAARKQTLRSRASALLHGSDFDAEALPMTAVGYGRRARRFLAGLGTVAMAALAAAGCLQMRLGNSESGLVLENLVSRDSRLAARTPEPRRRTLAFRPSEPALSADVYLPADTVRAGIVLVPGLAPAGKNDPRLTHLARTLARVHFAVLIPEVPGFRTYRVGVEDVDVLVDAIESLAALPEMQPRIPAGIGAFSFAVGPAVIAALDRRVAQRVDFVVAVGGYYDLRQLITYYTTGAYRGDAGAPTPYDKGKWIFALGMSERIPDERDRAAIRAIAWRGIHSNLDASDMPAPASLTPAGAAFLELLTNTTRERVPELLDELPESLKTAITALDPAEQPLRDLHAKLLLLHGRTDNVIPYTQSMALAAAVAPGHARLFLVDGLAHVDLQPTSADIDVLLEMVDALLAERAPAR